LKKSTSVMLGRKGAPHDKQSPHCWSGMRETTDARHAF
jgi:hypothetical protein